MIAPSQKRAEKCAECGKEQMAWSWQESYNAALLEKNPETLPERLVTAEKALLRRMQELPDSTDELPEVRALRQALDSLYALRPQEHHPPGEFADEETNRSRRNWTRVAVAVALALFLSSAARWVIARKTSESKALRAGASGDAVALAHSRTATVIEPGEKSALDALSREYAPSAGAPRRPADAQVNHANGDARLGGGNGRDKQNENTGTGTHPTASVRAAAGSDTSVTPARVPSVPPLVPGNLSENALPMDAANQTPESASTNAAAASAKTEELLQAPGNAVRGQSPLPESSVSVTTSMYPSIRIPPELSSETALSAASLQIGTPISRPDPVYPEEAERQGVQGTAKLRVVIGKDGSVQDVQVLSGPPLLASAGASAIRQWRYDPTFLGDQAVEVSEEVTIVFRLASTTAAAN
jgi:TonB family protein